MVLYIFSDAHLGCGSPEQEQLKRDKIASLFELIRADGGRLVILGDLFDFWFEYHHAIPKEYHDVLCWLSRLVEQGITVDYVSGNHDFWMGDFFEKQLHLRVHRDTLDLSHEGQRLHLIHGDGLAKADRGYRFLKRILRHPVNIWLYRKLPPDWAMPLAKKVSGSSRRYTARRDHVFAKDYEEYAEAQLTEGYDFVAIGHLHIPVIKEFGNGVYLNTGDFINHFSYAKLSDGKMTLEYLK
ncbi:MAG: UDP-2,3-diacylglucosamine diphosphatase [candidate division Zixibacteria bacterium]|nr:UDP-2,3-diacylglucosamine diphosphatase [candidate division Zixibacteria bacterium]